MAMTEPTLTTYNEADLQQKAKDHLWMHFSRQSVMESGAGVPIIVKGEGHHIWDSTGRKYKTAILRKGLWLCHLLQK